jgi:O-antigen/teichoic acid export membrane protein
MALKLGRTAALHFLSQVALSVSGFVATFAIARVLGASGVGIYALGMSLVVWMNVPLSGFQEALKKRVSEGVDREAYFTAGTILNVASVTVPAVGLLLFQKQINAYVGAPVALLIAVVLVTNGVFNTVRDTLHGEKKVAKAGWVRFAERTLRTVFQVALLLTGYGIAGLFVGHTVALVVGSLIGVSIVSLRPTRPKRVHFERLVGYAKNGWSGGLKGNAFNYMDIIVLGFFVSPTLVGIYKVAWTLGSFLVVVSNSVSSTLFPEISDISESGGAERVKHYLDEGFVFSGLFLIPGLFGAAALGNKLLRIYNTEFTRGATILVILVAALILDAYASQILSVIKALDRPDIALRIELVLVGGNVVLNFVLVYLFGWYGAAVATFVSGGLTLGLSYLAISRLVGTPSVPYREIGEEVVASVLMFACILGLGGFAPAGVVGTLSLVCAGAAIYTVLLLGISPRIRQKARALTPPGVRRFARL